MTAQIGDRVVAVRNGDATTIYLYGYGTYAGRQVAPGWNPDAEFTSGQTYRQKSEEIIRHEMSQPQEEFILQGRPTGMDQWGNPMNDPRTFDERVQAHLDGWGGNPRIDLDTGGSVFGYLCWWSSVKRYEKLRGDKAEVFVPVPDPLPRRW